MALSDLEAFIQERATVFDETIDLTPGSPFDAKVIQPILRRLGTDPFSLDIGTFIETRLLQEFPDLANKSGDATTDLLEKPAIVLWDPIVREIQRIRNSLSLKDPTILTVDEAEALGANFFATRNTGSFATGVVRLYFAAPQSVSVAPANFITSKTGLHFFATKIQSIQTNEMVFNVEGSLFYFDVNLIAEAAGDAYNIGPDELVTIANITSAVRITNKRRFRDGLPAENAEQFIDRAQQELTERSLVTLRGIAAVVPNTFPEITRLAVVGFNDPEMQRDVIEGGGLGDMHGFGVNGQAVADGENKVLTRQLFLPEILSFDPNGFLGIVGPAGVVTGWVVTVFNAFGGTPPAVRDLPVKAVLDNQNLDLVDQVLAQTLFSSPFAWSLRKKELTLSGIPGGILFPDSPNGTVTIPDGQIHVGGTTDILIRGIDFDTGALLLSSIVDDDPLLEGVDLSVVDGNGNVSLGDFVLGTNYTNGDATYSAVASAAVKAWTLQILEGPAAGSYRVLLAVQSFGGSPIFTVTPAPLFAATPSFQNLRWKLTDILDIDLVEPKETKISGSDMSTVQNVDQVTTLSGTDFDTFGVAVGDIVRLFNGPDAGDYTVVQVLAPFFATVQIDKVLKFSTSGVKYAIFRKNATGGVTRPLIRITSIDLLDTSGQPVGSTVPYALPVDVRSTAFANVGAGVRAQGHDGLLGLIGTLLTNGEASVNGRDLNIRYNNGANTADVVFSGIDPIPLATIISQINAAIGAVMAVNVNGRLGLIPFGSSDAPLPATELISGTAVSFLFGGTFSQYRHSREVNSKSVNDLFGHPSGWVNLKPSIDSELDVLQIIDGMQIGFYDDPQAGVAQVPPPPGQNASTGLTVQHDFAPEANVFFQFGSRSIGKARVFFLEPTSIEFPPEARIEVLLDSGITLNYKTDPTVEAQLIPALPSGLKPMDGDTTDPSNIMLASPSTDFVQKGVQPGDLLVIDFAPITGIVNLTDPVPALQFLTLVISVNGGPDKTITFLTDSLSIPPQAVTRTGVVTQINQTVGQSICSIVPGGGGNFLEFYPNASIVIRATGTANAALLGLALSQDKSNAADNAGTYTITAVLENAVLIDNTVPPFGFQTLDPRQQFTVMRPATQRIGSTQMSTQTTDAGLYYCDVQLVSEGTGDLWNIDADLQMTVEGFASDGYYLTTTDPNLSFSPAEQITLHVSRSIREVGVSDDADNETQLSGQNLQVNYEYSSLTTALNNFVQAETERVINDSPLGRHLVPNFVRFDLNYSGGSDVTVVTADIETLIENVQPQDALEVSAIEQIVLGRGADAILNPIELVAVVYNQDRTVTLNRSEDQLTTGRLSAFIPDILNITRKTS